MLAESDVKAVKSGVKFLARRKVDREIYEMIGKGLWGSLKERYFDEVEDGGSHKSDPARRVSEMLSSVKKLIFVYCIIKRNCFEDEDSRYSQLSAI